MQCTIFMHVEQEMMRNMAPPKHACAKLAACFVWEHLNYLKKYTSKLYYHYFFALG